MAKNQQVDIDYKLTTMYVAGFFPLKVVPHKENMGTRTLYMKPYYCGCHWAHEEKEAK